VTGQNGIGEETEWWEEHPATDTHKIKKGGGWVEGLKRERTTNPKHPPKKHPAPTGVFEKDIEKRGDRSQCGRENKENALPGKKRKIERGKKPDGLYKKGASRCGGGVANTQ